MSVTPTPTPGGDASVMDVNDIYGLIGKVGRQVIRGAYAGNPMSAFDKGYLPTGDTIEDFVIKLAESRAYDKLASNVITPSAPGSFVKYFREWTDKQFYAHVWDSDARAVALAGVTPEAVAEIAGRTVTSLTEGETAENFDDYKALLAAMVASQNGYLRPAQYVAAPTDVTDLVEKIRDTVMAFTFTNDTYAGVSGLKTKAALDRLRIIIPYKLLNKIDVRVMASLFNMEKADLMASIIPVDTTDGYVFVTDIDAIGKVVRTRTMRNAPNLNADCEDYVLHVCEMFYYNPLYKTAAIPAAGLLA